METAKEIIIMQVGIFGTNTDDEVTLLKKRLESKDVTVSVIDFSNQRLDVSIVSKGILYNDKNLLDFDCFYIRQLGYFLPVPDIQMSIGTWIDYYFSYHELLSKEIETLSLKHSIVEMLNTEKLVVNPYESFKYHRLKPFQMYLFKKNGLKIPDFVVTEDPRQYLIGKMVRKPLSGGEHVEDALCYLNDNPSIDKPVLMQDYIKGDTLRVFSTDEEFIGCAKEVKNGEHIDSRVDQSGGIKVVDIPEEVKETTIKAMQLLGMKFSGVDFIESCGEYFLIECNPSPMFYNFEYLSGIRVSEKLCEYLLSKIKGERK
jgi:hypothetical protein